jgi:signal transduction histidine kinase/ActR/RegA family two-component response regulator
LFASSGFEGSQARPASVADLEGCIRDLMGLLALPALWTGRDPGRVLTMLCEALEAVLPLRACYARSNVLGPANRDIVFRVGGEPAAPNDPAWQPFIETCRRAKNPRRGYVEETPVGPLHVVRVDMDYQADSGVLFAGSSDPNFPTTTQSAFLRAAVSLAATGLYSARLMHEREEASRAKDEFLAMLGHELRNPLAPIVTALNLITLRSGNRLTRESQIIERQVGHLIRLVDDLLDISRVARGKVELKCERIEVSEAVGKALETASPLLEQRRHYLSLEVPKDGLLVEADPTRMAQILANLLTNAAKYTDPGGNIAVRAWREESSVWVSVKDNGMGIAPELLPHVFDLFQQGRRTMDRAEGGLGIGLALVKSLTMLHGGTVRAYSEGPGLGSEFRIGLPLVTGEHAPIDEHAGTSGVLPAVRRERVLVVDDNQDAAELIADVLRAAGHEVLVANDAFEALSIIDRSAPSVVVLDIGLPVMNGYELAARVRETLGHYAPRMIALTGYGLDHDRQRSHAAGIHAHLVKPIGGKELLEAIETTRVEPHPKR